MVTTPMSHRRVDERVEPEDPHRSLGALVREAIPLCRDGDPVPLAPARVRAALDPARSTETTWWRAIGVASLALTLAIAALVASHGRSSDGNAPARINGTDVAQFDELDDDDERPPPQTWRPRARFWRSPARR